MKPILALLAAAGLSLQAWATTPQAVVTRYADLAHAMCNPCRSRTGDLQAAGPSHICDCR